MRLTGRLEKIMWLIRGHLAELPIFHIHRDSIRNCGQAMPVTLPILVLGYATNLGAAIRLWRARRADCSLLAQATQQELDKMLVANRARKRSHEYVVRLRSHSDRNCLLPRH